MTGRDRQHEVFEELAAGCALDALEPEDEQLFLRHLTGCALCEGELGAHLETAAQLAWAAVPVTGGDDVPEALFARVREAVVAKRDGQAFVAPRRGGSVQLGSAPAAPRGRGGGSPAGRGVSRGPRRAVGRRGPRGAAVISVAAALVLLLGLAGLQVVPGAQPPTRGQQVAQALRAVDDGSGRRVPLLDDQQREAAVAVVSGGRVSLVVHGLEANAEDDTTYVLWGVERGGAARALGTFDVDEGDVEVVRELPLRGPGEVAALAVTREPGAVAPARPGQEPLVVGQV